MLTLGSGHRPEHGFRDPSLDLDCWRARDGSGFVLAPLQDGVRDIVAPSPPLLGGMAWAHPVAAIVEQLAREKGVRVAPRSIAALGARRKQRLDTIPSLLIDDRIVNAIVSSHPTAAWRQAGSPPQGRAKRKYRRRARVPAQRRRCQAG
jgi:hypothetical protein